jgi:hypothetical protein
VEAVKETNEGEFDDDFGSFENKTPPKTPSHNNLKNNDYSSYGEFGEFSSNPYTREKNKNEKIIDLDRLEKTPQTPQTPPQAPTLFPLASRRQPRGPAIIVPALIQHQCDAIEAVLHLLGRLPR